MEREKERERERTRSEIICTSVASLDGSWFLSILVAEFHGCLLSVDTPPLSNDRCASSCLENV